MNEEKFVRARINSGETIITETALEEKKEIHKPSQSLLNSNPLSDRHKMVPLSHPIGTSKNLNHFPTKP